MQNTEQFLNNLMGLAETLGHELSQAALLIYEKILSKYSDEQLEAAIMRAAATLKWFPKPVELVELIEGRGGDRAMLAWECVFEAMHRQGPYKSVLFEDGRITRVIKNLGGWVEVCSWKESEMQYRRNDFLKMYAALPDGEPEVLHGIIAIDNAANGFLKFIPEPVRIAAPSPLIGAPEVRLQIEFERE